MTEFYPVSEETPSRIAQAKPWPIPIREPEF